MSAAFSGAMLLAACWHAPAQAQPRSEPNTPRADYVHDVWRAEDGLPHNGVYAVLQSADGYLWLGTASGLVRFDGVRFAQDLGEQDPLLENSYVWTLREDADGALWAGTGNGLSRIEHGRVATYTTEQGLPNDFVRTLARDADGRLWIGTYSGGLCRMADETCIPYGPAEGLPDPSVNTLLVDRDGTLWVGADGGLYRFEEGRFVSGVPPPQALRENVRTLYEDRAGILWIGTGRDLYRFRRGAMPEPLLDAGAPLGAIRAIYQDHEGALWIGTEADGLLRYRGGAVERVALGEGAAPSDVRAIYQDREGSLWIGTNGDGLHRLHPSRVTVYDASDGLPSDIASAIYEDRAGTMWLGTNAGLVRLDGDQIRTYTEQDGLPNEHVFALAGSRDGQLWIGTNDGGLARLQDGAFTTYTTRNGLPSNAVFSLYRDRQNRLWVGTSNGLCQWTGGRCAPINRPDGTSLGLVVLIEEDRLGRLWIGTDHSLIRLEDGQFTTLTTEDGLPSDAIRALHEDAKGVLWIGTRGGLARYQDGEITAFTTRQGLPDPVIYQILEDRQGHLWMSGSSHGIVRVRKDELDAVARGEAETVSAITFGRSDGLRSLEGVGGVQPAGWKSRDGRLWFPTLKGFVVIDPERMRIDATPPPVHIEEVLIDGEPAVALGGSLRVPPDARRLEIRYTGLSFLDPKRVQFRYRLIGQDEAWSYDRAATGARRAQVYSNLAPGGYAFEVTAANRDGVWNRIPATLNLDVIPPWWRRPWAYALYALLLGLGIYGVVRGRVWSLEQRNKELESMVAERTAQIEAQAERLRALDAVKSRFFANISHEFRTPLTLILGPLEQLAERTPEGSDRALLRGAKEQGERLLRLVGQLLDLTRLDAGGLALHSERQDLAGFLRRIAASFQSLAEAQGVTLTFHAEEEPIDGLFDAEKMEQVVYNLLANAIRFTPEGGKVQLGVEADSDAAFIRVQDTGPGIPERELPHIFDRFYQAENASGTGGSGIGLALARELMRLHGGDLQGESTLGFGSTFIAELPLRREEAPLAEESSSEAFAPSPPPEPLADGSIQALVDEEADGETPREDAPLVLLVEDHAELRAYLRRCLHGRYRIAEAASGEEGLRAARDLQPALVISDVMMPGMDGYALCRQLKAEADLSPIPVILLTARAAEEDKLEGLEAGADDYLAKPFSAAELRARAENLIEIRRLLRRRFSDEVIVQPTRVAVPSADAAFLEQVRNAVEANIGDSTFGVERLAEDVNLSRRQLHRKMQALAGLSTVGFIRMMRLERAAQLLEQQAGTVSEIAYAVGFRDANYFSRIFRQAYDQTPSEYMAEPPMTDRS